MSVPEQGELVSVRNRRYVIADVLAARATDHLDALIRAGDLRLVPS